MRPIHSAILPYLPSRPPLRTQQGPQLADADALDGKHAVLQAIKVLAVDRRDKLPRDEAQEDAGREVVFPQAVAELGVLVDRLREGEWDGLDGVGRSVMV